MKTRHSHALLAAWLLAAAFARSEVVDSAESFGKVAALLTSGSVIEFADATYATKGGIKLVGKKGALESPIVLRAQHRGKAVIAGEAGFILKDCKNLVLEGFVFENE